MVVDNELATPHELESDLGPYWMLANSSKAYVLSTITSYSNIEASKSTPQYGFNRGLKEFGELGYQATVKELDDNLLGMGAVRMLKPSEMNRTIRFEALNSSPAIMPLAALYFGVIFLKGHISLKNGTYCPFFSHDTTFFKSTCFLIRLKVLLEGLYGPHLHCEPGQ
jgi:hypothetical protein